MFVPPAAILPFRLRADPTPPYSLDHGDALS